MYDAAGKGRLHALKNDAGKQARYPGTSLADARRQALNLHHDPDALKPKPPSDTFAVVAQRYLASLDQRGVRTVAHMRGQLERYIFPLWANVEVSEIRRSQIMQLRDRIAAGDVAQPDRGWRKRTQLKGGERTADQLISTLRSIFNHHALRSDSFNNPIVRGMSIMPGGVRRTRILSDVEVAKLWEVTDISASAQMSPLDPVFCALVRFALLTGIRMGKITALRWSDIDRETGLLTLPVEHRAKPHVGKIVLPALAMQVLAGMRRLPGTDLVFTDDGHPFNKFARQKQVLDRALQFEKPFVIHDLRRTCRSVMSKVGVSTEIAELAIGHTRGGIIDVYDQHDFTAEKSEALARVADHIARVVGANVVALAAASR
jgi:integrase